MKDRIKKLRKQLGMTQAAFGETIEAAPNTVACYESGVREPSNKVISLICVKHRVNERWLRCGEEPMFLPEPKNEIDELLERHGLTENERVAFECYLRLSEDERAALMKFLNDFADSRVVEEPTIDELARRAGKEAEQRVYAEHDSEKRVEKSQA